MPERGRHRRTGSVLYTRADIEQGRQVWQSIGGMQLGSIWGHGSYVAPDWTADWLHREAVAWLDIAARARARRMPTPNCRAEQQAALQRAPAAADPRATPTTRRPARSRSPPTAPRRSRTVAAHYESPVRQRPGDCSSCARPTR